MNQTQSQHDLEAQWPWRFGLGDLGAWNLEDRDFNDSWTRPHGRMVISDSPLSTSWLTAGVKRATSHDQDASIDKTPPVN